jgi:hypothetical protein
MIPVASVVEGHSEVEAVPILLRRFVHEWNVGLPIVARRPVRVSRSKLLKEGELERAAQLAVYQARGGGVLILIDADDDCPAEMGPALLQRLQTVTEDGTVVLAKSEFESWFIAAAESIRNCRGLRPDLMVPTNVESIRDAKGWLTENMVDQRFGYSETLDQPALTATFDIDAARTASESFDKLCRAVSALFERLRKTAQADEL